MYVVDSLDFSIDKWVQFMKRQIICPSTNDLSKDTSLGPVNDKMHFYMPRPLKSIKIDVP